MATPLTPDHLLSALKAEGVKVVEHPGWRTHERDAATGKPFGPVHGVMIHHTAALNAENVVYNGRSDLPGPLAHLYIDKQGVAHLLSAGRANHAGGGDKRVLDAVIAETYPLPAPTKHEGSSGAADGNDAFYGFECENLGDGEDHWPAVQMDAIRRAAAAICRAHDWSEKSVIGHKEWSDWKVDPKGFTMTSLRDSIGERLDHAANWTKSSTTTTTTSGASMPTGGPFLLALARTGDQGLSPSTWSDVYWDTEYTDEGSVYSGSGATFGNTGYYNGEVYVRLGSMEVGKEFQVRIVEVDSSGTEVQTFPISEGIGTSGSSFHSHGIAGKLPAGHKLKVQVNQFGTANAISETIEVKIMWTLL